MSFSDELEEDGADAPILSLAESTKKRCSALFLAFLYDPVSLSSCHAYIGSYPQDISVYVAPRREMRKGDDVCHSSPNCESLWQRYLALQICKGEAA